MLKKLALMCVLLNLALVRCDDTSKTFPWDIEDISDDPEGEEDVFSKSKKYVCVYQCTSHNESDNEKGCASSNITIRLYSKEIDLKEHKTIQKYCESTGTKAYNDANNYCLMINCGGPDVTKSIYF
jgi:hypothetical protein